MNILFAIHLYYPQHGAGAESMVRNISSYMIKKGHNVHILLMESKHYNVDQVYDFEGAMVIPADSGRDLTQPLDWADIVFTHLTWTSWAAHICSIKKKPLVFLSHNTHPYDILRAFPNMAVVYNSEAMRGILKYQNRSIVVHPPVDYRKNDLGGPTGEYITLVNLTANKGSKLFINIAKAMPGRKFLGVGGSYDPQYREELPNVTYLPNSPDMAKVYRMTRILVCPSKYESWGMCATEAMCNGIPVIYHPTFGLCENVGENGIAVKDVNPTYDDVVDRRGGESPGLDPVANVAAWVKAIKKLDDKKTYQKYSNLARARGKQLDPDLELAELEKFIFNEVRNY